MLPRNMRAPTLGGLAAALLLVLGVIWFAASQVLWAQSDGPVLPAEGVVITEDSRLNMRSGPSTDFPIVIKLDPQTPVTVVDTDQAGDWFEVEVAIAGFGNGWVAAEYIGLNDDVEAAAEIESEGVASLISETKTLETETPEIETAGTETPETDGAGEGTTGGDSNTAGAHAGQELVLLPTPTPTPEQTAAAGLAALFGVQATEQEAVDGEALNSEVGDGEAEGSPTVQATAIVTSATVSSEGTATTTSGVATVTPTATVSATSSAGGTALSADEAGAGELVIGADGVVTTATNVTPAAGTSTPGTSAAGAPVATQPPPTATPQPTPDTPEAVIQPERMNVRGGPSTNFTVVDGADGGAALEITGADPAGEWYRVALAGGDEGWVYSPLVEVVGPASAIETVSEEELPAEPTPVAETSQSSVAAPSVAAPPPAGGGSFGYGVQAHMLGGGIGPALNAVNDLGFNWIKQQVQWHEFQPNPGPAGFGELSAIVSEAESRGINVLFSVVNAPAWARESDFDDSVGGPPADPQTFASFVGAMAGQYCGTSLKAIEVWNEQNLHYEWGNKPLDPAAYMHLLAAAYGSIKSACPEMLVISGALTPAGDNPPFAMDDFAYLEGMYQNGLANYADGIGAHPSGYNVPPSVTWENACAAIQESGNTFNGACETPHHSWSFRSTMEGYRNIMNVYGDSNKRIWPTEFGWAAGGALDPRYAYADDNSFEEQAAWTVESFRMMRDWGWVGPAFLWNLNFRVVADGTEKAQWGIVRNDYSPLPVYDALKAMPK